MVTILLQCCDTTSVVTMTAASALVGPVQYLFLAVGLVIALVGLARGYDKELGNAIIFMLTIALLGFIQLRYEYDIANFFGSLLGVSNVYLFMMLLFTITFCLVVFSSYSGMTFIYGTGAKSDFGGNLISLGVGLFNGYLVAGTLWYYADRYGYPWLNVIPLAGPEPVRALGLLPQTIFPDPIYWLVPAAVLLILRIRG